MKIPVDHIIRPRLPWRSPTEPSITECGYDASKVKTLTREQWAERLKDYGRQRAGLVTCMTCLQTAERHPAWAEDPRLAVTREANWEVQWWDARGAREINGHRLKDELQAIATLIERHGSEFRELLSGIEAQRQWIDRKAKREKTQ